MKRILIVSMAFLFCGCLGKAGNISQTKNEIQPEQVRFTPDNAGITVVGRGYNISGQQTAPPIETLVIDPMGRKTGYDPATASLVYEIPNSIYEQDASIGIDSEEDVPASEQPPAYSDLDATQAMSGEYKIQLLGKDAGEYELSVRGMTAAAELRLEQKYFGLTEKGRIAEFRLNFNKTPGSVSTVTKTVTFQSLRDDVRLAKQFGYIDNEGISNSLAQKLNNAEEAKNKGNIKPAQNILEALINEINAQTDKHIKKTFADIFVADIAAFIRTL